ncbi:hypothetical protein [Aquiflexum lacus]|uniref:hypothetical protein n=1 Tax=Aquiflexum lacus TaxID=2483805 RepID=UPI001895D46E|nr:hypothetical protein [Aquiflexum lacus]
MIKSFHFIFSISLSLFTLQVSGQVETLQDVSIPGAPLIANAYPEVKGNPYLSDFSQGYILVSKIDTIRNIAIRFNLYGNMLEVNRLGELMGYTGKNIHGFIIEPFEAMEIYKSGFDLPKLGKGTFAQVLTEGKYTLLKYKYKYIADDPSAAYGSQKSKAFQSKMDFFVVHQKNVFPFKTKRKQLNAVFGVETSKVLDLIGVMNIDLRNEDDMVKLIRALNN